MIRGSTPDYILRFNGYDLTDKRIYITIKQRGKELTKTNEDVDISVDTSGQTPLSTVAFSLSQQETLALVEGHADIQCKIIDSTGHVDPTDIKPLTIGRALLERVISYDANSTL